MIQESRISHLEPNPNPVSTSHHFPYLGPQPGAMASSATAPATTTTPKDEWTAPGSFTAVGTHFILDGPPNGKLVVCVPGLGGPMWYFEKLAPALVGAGYRVLRYDLLGRGFSKPPPVATWRPSCLCVGVPRDQDPYGLDGHVAQLRQLLVEVGGVRKEGDDDMDATRHNRTAAPAAKATAAGLSTPQVHFVGHSMGGAIALGYADRYPDDVASLTLLSPAGLMDPGVFQLLRSLPCFIQDVVEGCLRRNSLNAVRNDFVVHGTDSEKGMVERVKRMHVHNPHAFHAIFRSLLAFPLAGLDEVVRSVAATRPSVLLVWAWYDRVLPFEPHYGRWKKLLKTGQNTLYEVVADAGHGFPLEKPEVVNDLVLRFLKSPPTWVPPALMNALSQHPPTITI